MKNKERWFQTRTAWSLGLGPLFLFFIAFYALDPMIEWQTRKRLAVFEGYDVTFDDASLQPGKFNYAVTGVRIVKPSAGGDAVPYIEVPRMEMNVAWRELLRLNLVSTVEFVGARVDLIAATSEGGQQLGMGIPNFTAKLDEAVPLDVDHIKVRDLEIVFTDRTKPGFPQVRLHGLDGTIENIARDVKRDAPTVIALSGSLMKSGEVSGYITADPRSEELSFTGRMSVTHLEMNEFTVIIASQTGVRLERGTLELYAEFACRNGALTGGVKSLLTNAKIVAGKSGADNAIKAVVADAAVNVLSDKVGGDQVLALLAPIKEDLGADARLLSSVAKVLRDAFVIGVSEGFERLPFPSPGMGAMRPGGPAMPAAPSGLMIDTGARAIQNALIAKGLLPAQHTTGVLDGETAGALRRFQGEETLARTGAPDRETIRRLGVSAVEVFRPTPGS